MSKSAYVCVRCEPELKETVETVLEDLGLTHSDAIRLLYQQIAAEGKLPFPPVPEVGDSTSKQK